MYKSLSDLVVRSHGGGTPSRSIAKYWNGNIPWATVKDFSDDTTELADTEEHITPEGLRSSAAQLVPAQTPIACMRMAVGRIAVFDREVAINQDLRALYSAACINTRYFLKQLAFSLSSLQGLTTGTTVKGLSTTDLLRLSVYVPEDSNEQCFIATVLDAANEAIAKTEVLIAKLKAIKQGLLHDLLTRGLDNNGELRNPEKHPKEFKDSELGRIPKDWVVWSVNEVGRIVAGSTPSRSVSSYWSGDVPWITPTDMTALASDYIKGGKDSLTRKGLSSCAAVLLPPGSIVVTTRASLGLAAITCCALATNQGFKNVVPDRGWDSTFLCYSFRRLTGEMVKRASGTTFLEISGTQFGLIKFAAPRLESGEQERIGNIIRAQAHRIELEVHHLFKLKAIKKGLTQDLLTGRVRVPAEKIAALATG